MTKKIRLCLPVWKMQPIRALGMKGLPVSVLQSGFPAQTQMGHMRLLNPLQLPVAARRCTLHRNEEEHFVVLAGTYRILIEDKVLDAPVGTSVTVPRGSRYSWRNISNETSRLLVILTPGCFEKCIQTIRDSPADKVLEIAAHYGCFIVGPPISI